MKRILALCVFLLSLAAAPAFAQQHYFAHVETGKALEPQPAPSVPLYLKFVGTGVDTSGWQVVEVPAGTQHGAADNHNGTFTNPAPPATANQPDLPPAAFMDLCYGVFGAIAQPGGSQAQQIAAGIARYGEIIRAARASASDPVLAVVERYDAAKAGGMFSKSQVATFFVILANAGVMTAGEGNAVVAAWPSR